MKISCSVFGERRGRVYLTLALPLFGLSLVSCSVAADPPAPAGGLAPVTINFPQPGFKGTPKDIPTNSFTEPYPDKPPKPVMAPAGLKNIASGAKLSSSDKNATADTLAKIVDGDKDASEQSIIYLRKGPQWVQMDFGSVQEIYAAVIWHAHNAGKIYRAVAVQVADDPDFIENVRTIFNNDQNNVAGLGVGTDREYFETQYGKQIDCKGVKARYMRFYSKGSTESALNEYTEIEVYGRPTQLSSASGK
ncbi:MAG: hypothetical protein C5B50_13870 [Verrucomicrobia bacterium]|nr:MAG: hypothetical protein C5B50_13870 [Verrucomicrobiota bacterium]